MPKTERGNAKVDAGFKNYSESGIHRLMVQTMKKFAAHLAETKSEFAGKSKTVRAHALRHTFGTHAMEANIPIDVLQAYFGHASPATTGLYMQSGRRRRVKEISKLYA